MKKSVLSTVLLLFWNSADGLTDQNFGYEFCVEDVVHPIELSMNSSHWLDYRHVLEQQSILTSKRFTNDAVFAHHSTHLQQNPVQFRISEKQGKHEMNLNNDITSEKSSVSTLYELCAKYSTPLSFQIDSEGPAHKKIFTSTCTAGEHITNGQGSSKSLAKQTAAREMLKLLKGLNSTVPAEVKKRKQKPIKHSPETDPIPYLQEWSNHRIQYIEGDHTKGLFEIKCLLDDLKTIGNGRSKKIAKRMAALEMIKSLRDNGKLDMNHNPPENHAPKPVESDNAGDIAEETVHSNYFEATDTYESSEIKNSDHNKEDINSDKNIPSNRDATQSEDMESLLRSVGQEMGYEINFRDITSGQAHVSFVSISSGTSITCYGIGSQKEHSRQEASRAAIEHLNANYWIDLAKENTGIYYQYVSKDSDGFAFIETELK